MTALVSTGQPNVTRKAVSLYPSDVEAVEQLRARFDLDSFSQAIRRAIRIATESVDDAQASQDDAA